MRNKRPKNADELKAAVKETWASIPPQQCHKLITSMPRRIEGVIKAKEAPTKYWVHIQWGKKVFSQPPIVQVLPLKKMREVCNFHHRYTSTMRDKIRKKSRKSHCRIFKEFICKLWWKISIWSPTNKQDCWLSQTCNFFFKRLLCPPLVTCINGICLNSLSV